LSNFALPKNCRPRQPPLSPRPCYGPGVLSLFALIIDNKHRVCQGFRLTKRDIYFWVNFDHFWIEQYFWRQMGHYWRLARAGNRTTIGKFSLPKSVECSVVTTIIIGSKGVGLITRPLVWKFGNMTNMMFL